MKKVLLGTRTWLLLVMALVITVSCEKDPTDSELIVGTWTVESVTADMTINGKSFVTYYVEDMGITQAEAETYYNMFLTVFDNFTGSITMKDDNTYSSNMGGETGSGTWELSGEKLTMDKGTEDESIMNITTLTESKLVLEYSETDTDDYNGDDIDETTVSTMKFSFNK